MKYFTVQYLNQKLLKSNLKKVRMKVTFNFFHTYNQIYILLKVLHLLETLLNTFVAVNQCYTFSRAQNLTILIETLTVMVREPVLDMGAWCQGVA